MTAAPLPGPSPEDLKLAPLSECAKIIGVEMNRMYEYSAMPLFPPPKSHVACLPVFSVGEVRRFIVQRGRSSSTSTTRSSRVKRGMT